MVFGSVTASGIAISAIDGLADRIGNLGGESQKTGQRTVSLKFAGEVVNRWGSGQQVFFEVLLRQVRAAVTGRTKVNMAFFEAAAMRVATPAVWYVLMGLVAEELNAKGDSGNRARAEQFITTSIAQNIAILGVKLAELPESYRLSAVGIGHTTGRNAVRPDSEVLAAWTRFITYTRGSVY